MSIDNIHIIKEPITRLELKKIADETFGYVVKGAVDIEQEKIGLGGELHINITV